MAFPFPETLLHHNTGITQNKQSYAQCLNLMSDDCLLNFQSTFARILAG